MVALASCMIQGASIKCTADRLEQHTEFSLDIYEIRRIESIYSDMTSRHAVFE